MASAIESMENGSTSKAASPATSGIEDIFEVITGVSQLKASRIGIPKPSKQETKVSALSYSNIKKAPEDNQQSPGAGVQVWMTCRSKERT